MSIQSFWKPIKSKPMKSVKNYGTPNLNKYTKRTSRENKLIIKNPYGDTDKDKVMNWYDCRPLNKKQQGWAHKGLEENRERSTHIKMMNPEKFIRTTYIETLNKAKVKLDNKGKPIKGQTYESQLKSYKTYSKPGSGWHDPENVEDIKKALKDPGERVPIPFLEYDVQGRPTGHEGRHRAMAAKQLGIKLMPVTIGRQLKQPRDWKKMRESWRYKTTKKDWRNDLENAQTIISTKSADIPIEEQKTYGKERPEALERLPQKIIYNKPKPQKTERILEKEIEESVMAPLQKHKLPSGKYMNLNYPTRQEILEEIKLSGKHGTKSAPPISDMTVLTKKDIIKTLKKNPDVYAKLKKEGIQISFKNSWDAVHADIGEYEGYEKGNRSIATYRPAFKTIEINPIFYLGRKYGKDKHRWGMQTPLITTLKHELAHVDQDFSQGRKNLREQEREAREKMELPAAREIKLEARPDVLQKIAHEMVEKEDRMMKVKQLKRKDDYKKEDKQTMKIEKEARREYKQIMKLEKEAKKEKQMKDKESRKMWSGMSDYQKHQVGKVIAKEFDIPEYMHDRFASEIVKSY